MRIQVLALDGVFDTGLAAVLDMLGTANTLAPTISAKAPIFDVSVVGLRQKVRTAHGLQVPVAGTFKPKAGDWIVVPAVSAPTPDTLMTALNRRDVKDACGALRESAKTVEVAAACMGTFILAEAGVLDEQRATTTWWLAPVFRQQYPRVRLDEARMVVKSGRFLTAGAALGHIDMALSIVQHASPDLASLVARYLVVDSRSAQSAYTLADHLAYSDPMVERFERWARRHLTEGFSLDAAAHAVGTSKRTLARRLQQILGKSPLSYFQDLRVERAVHLLKTSRKSIDQIAEDVGYADGVTLRALIRDRLGRGVREVRKLG